DRFARAKQTTWIGGVAEVCQVEECLQDFVGIVMKAAASRVGFDQVEHFAAGATMGIQSLTQPVGRKVPLRAPGKGWARGVAGRPAHALRIPELRCARANLDVGQPPVAATALHLDKPSAWEIKQ